MHAAMIFRAYAQSPNEKRREIRRRSASPPTPQRPANEFLPQQLDLERARQSCGVGLIPRPTWRLPFVPGLRLQRLTVFRKIAPSTFGGEARSGHGREQARPRCARPARHGLHWPRLFDGSFAITASTRAMARSSHPLTPLSCLHRWYSVYGFSTQRWQQ
mmetsp:Transcript_22826/g.52626  ORF Transcript_22826/g.52626 Transcript_22826/m.52626 type:complete len:160 (-) Transcript_22826:167-646(-)